MSVIASIEVLPTRLRLREPFAVAYGTHDTADTVLVLEGRDGALIKGNFDFATNTGTGSGLRLRTGNLILRGLSFQNTGFCVKSEKASVVNQVLIENLTAKNVHTCILVDRDSTQPVTRWIVRDSSIQGYYRAAIRLAGSLFTGVLLAAAGASAQEPIRIGAFLSVTGPAAFLWGTRRGRPGSSPGWTQGPVQPYETLGQYSF